MCIRDRLITEENAPTLAGLEIELEELDTSAAAAGLLPADRSKIGPFRTSCTNAARRMSNLSDDQCAAYETIVRLKDCLLYTSDAADDLLCVDLGGRRIIKKKKK
eukprot:TRINITY_DN25373_c0_g1_i1.p1 TRINITY_DN25373_c0_g1~~TRINITY_DN25373_c0_g1_i1.p1  ORF type:complete len:105 (+),score=47.00 TRINITY_DN25373_c0_g1_i1:133-447(+)